MRKNLWIVALVLAAWLPSLGSIAYSSVWQWSKTASSNASADPTVNWREGQPPSSVNDSGRAMMAALAQYSADTSGSLLTTGSATAYAVTTNSAYVGETLAAISGRQIAFTVHTTSGATVVLNVDGLGNQPLRSAAGIELAAGALNQGTIYRATYNNSDSAWYLQDFYSSGVNVPIGGLVFYTGTTAPNASFVLPAGQAISRTTYAAYFSLVGTTYGPGDGVTTFNVPDYRGRLLSALDNLNGTPANRVTVAGGNWDGTGLGNGGGAQNRTIGTSNVPVLAFAGTTQTVNTNQSNIFLDGTGVRLIGNSGGTAGGGNASVTFTPAGSVNPGSPNSALATMPPAQSVGLLLRVL